MSDRERLARRHAVPRGRARRAGRHPAAPQPRARHPHDPRQARRGGRRGPRLGGAARGRTRDQGAGAAPPRRPSASSSRRRSQRAGGVVHWARDAEECQPDRRRASSPRHGVDEVVKVKSLTTEETGLNEALAAARHPGVGDRPGRADHPARPTTRRRTSWCRRSTRTASEIRALFARTLPDAPPDLSDDPRELAEAARAHLRKLFLGARVGISGVNFAVADTGTVSRGRVRGQRADVHDAARGAHQRHGDREGDPDLGGPRGLPPAAAPVLDRASG